VKIKIFPTPVTFLAFLAEVIRKTMLSKDNNESIDVCQFITKAAGDCMGLSTAADQLNIFLVNNEFFNTTVEFPFHL